jgi:ribosomal protein S18 acetylase RimI-like enzyme
VTIAYHLVERLPTVAEHRAMFEAVGWTPYAPQAAEISLKNSLFSVVVERKQDNAVVGIGRIIGDGGQFFYIQDVAVLPDLQGQGIGTLIMDRLIDWIKANAPHEPFVGLFSTQAAQAFYRRYGFDERRVVLSGMWLVLPVENAGK